LILGYFFFVVTGLSLLVSILLGAVVSSTDAAAVFSILESKKLNLKENTDTTLEFESATNDPMAMVLVLGLTLLILNPTTQPSFFILFFIKQLVIGGVVGVVFGLLAGLLLTRVVFEEKGLVPIFVLACVFIATLGSELLGGNRLIASYLIGVTLGNKTFNGRENTLLFFNSTSWLSQVTMFILLGL
jgi:cell volume regulation protein A